MSESSATETRSSKDIPPADNASFNERMGHSNDRAVVPIGTTADGNKECEGKKTTCGSHGPNLLSVRGDRNRM